MSLAHVLTLVAATAEIHAIEGRVDSSRTGDPLGGAIVVLQCTCMEGTRETVTDEEGRYRFGRLRAGIYVVNVLRGQADVSRVVKLGFAK